MQHKTNIQVFLYRERSSDQGTEGILFIPAVNFSCFTLELPWRANRSCISCIPAGEYSACLRQSPRFGSVYHVRNVPHRSFILLHSGNVAGDTSLGYRSNVQGCILLGTKRGTLYGQRAVLASRGTVRKMRDSLDGQPAQLRVFGVV